MKQPSPEDLEKLIHQALQSLPDRRAPRSLESNVWAAIEAQQALPWWRQSFGYWPVAIRAVFLVFTGVLAASLMALFIRVGPAVDTVATLSGAEFLSARLHSLFDGTTNSWAQLTRNIPLNWTYAGVAILAAMYTALIGLGATAYRLLFFQR